MTQGEFLKMLSYTVVGAAYDGSGTDQNPVVFVWGIVNGYRTAYMQVYWEGIQQAYAVAGQSGVQQFLAPILYSGVLLDQNPSTMGLFLANKPAPSPVFQSSNTPAPVTQQQNGTSPLRIPGTLYTSVVACTQAMVPGWSQ
jgi:hypothetical protein